MSFPEVNPFAESTWRNHPKPAEFPEFARALRELGGTSVNGHPNLRLQWAPDYFKWILGRPRLYYVDTRIPTRKKLRRMYYQVKDLTDPFASWITVEPENLGDYPAGVFLHQVHHDSEIVIIARNQWCIQQYFPPERLDDTPETWNERRFRFFTPPETNIPEFGDWSGPFPADGEYRLSFFLDAGRDYSYRAPDAQALELIRAIWQKREEYRRSVSRRQEIADEYAAQAAREEKRLEETLAALDDELKPYDRKAEGNAFVTVL